MIKRTNSENEDFQLLVSKLDAYLAVIDGEEHAFYAQYNKTGMLQHVVIYYVNSIAVGCGAFKNYNEDSVEIKRMYVLPEYRSKGIAAAILSELEKWANEIGYHSFVLETGKKQEDAIHLYSKCGYMLIPNYGQYENIENSVCMKKIIA
jgi:GNAT superfamily N-acetyltransferase